MRLALLLVFCASVAPGAAQAQTPASETPEEEAEEEDFRHPVWPQAMGWFSVGGLAVSAAVLIGASVRIQAINDDERWIAAREVVPITEDVCAHPSDSWVATRCDEGDRLAAAATASIVVGLAAIVSAVTFFAIDLTGAADEPIAITAVGSPYGVSLGVAGRF